MDSKLEGKTLTLYLIGELNSFNAQDKEKEISDELNSKEFKTLNLDFERITYVSSAGLRVILKLKQKYSDVHVLNTSLEVYDIFSMTGFTDMMDIQKTLKSVDVSYAEIVGEGYFSTVYRIDKDTIIKVFNRTSDPEQIQRELKLAKEAFVLGVPTAISFDIVKVGNKYGVRFEMLDCASLKNLFIENPNKYDMLLKKYVELLKKINTTECFDPNIPHVKDFYKEKIEIIKPFIEEKYYLKAKAILDTIPETSTFVHGDCHFKNIMAQGDDLLLIDMDTLSLGHPIFELAALYAPYVAFSEDDPGNCDRFLGLPDEKCKKLFYDIVRLYFGKEDPVVADKIKLLAYIHMIWWNRINEPQNDKRLEGCKSRLIPLLDKYDDAFIEIEG